jgi:hypothetical protein
VLFAEALHAFVIDLQAVPGIERRGRLTSHCLRIISHFLEQMLEPSRGNDLKDPARLVAGVPKSMPLVAGFEDEIPNSSRLRFNLISRDGRLETAFELDRNARGSFPN